MLYKVAQRVILFSAVLGLAGCNEKLAEVRQTALPDAIPIVLENRHNKLATGSLAITRIAHSGVLLDFNGKCILTDPWFSESSEYHPGELIGISVDKLPKLSAIIASHGHGDHFDLVAFQVLTFLDP